MAKKEQNDLAGLLERLLGTRSVLTVDLDNVGMVLGDRKFSFSGKLTLGPVVLGKAKSSKKK
ncbi:MAG: hypothetical protein HY558_04060 [Euryarchaeota archaeon]|nr:hypothetical protein [Euryarchaeota archaeon]